MQVAICAYLFVCTLVNVLVLKGKHHQCKLQWTMTTMSAGRVSAPVDGRKTPPAQVAQCQDHLALDTSIGKGCSNQMQLAQGNHLNSDLALVLPAIDCCILGALVHLPMCTNCNLHSVVVVVLVTYVCMHNNTSAIEVFLKN